MAFLPKVGKDGRPVYPTDKRVSKVEPLIIEILTQSRWEGKTVKELQRMIYAQYGALFGYSTVGTAVMKMTDDKLLARRWEWFIPADKAKGKPEVVIERPNGQLPPGVETYQIARRHVYYLPQYSRPEAGYW